MGKALERWKTAAEVRAHRRAQSKYEASEKEKTKRANRNHARRELEKEGKVHKGDGKDVMHVDGSALNNKPSNWKAGSRHKNRSYPRDSKAHKLYKNS